MTSRSRFVLAATLAISAGCAPLHTDEIGTLDPKAVVERLDNPDDRDAAACRIFDLQRYHGTPQYKDDPCTRIRGAVNHVVVAPQVSGPPMRIVFRRWDFDDKEIGPGRPRGPFSLIDGDGYIVPAFSGANMLDADSAIFPYAGDSRLAIGQIIPHGGGEGARSWTTQVLHIIPVTSPQQAVLSVIVGPSTYESDGVCAGFSWGWRQRDLDKDGIPEIEIGPWIDDKNIRPQAVYRWSQANSRYDGPEGSIEEGFVRLKEPTAVPGKCGCAKYEGLAEFALTRLDRGLREDASAVRKSRCEESFSSSITIP
jgi:hypothetical protein